MAQNSRRAPDAQCNAQNRAIFRGSLVKSARIVPTPLRVEVQLIRELPEVEARSVGDVVGIDVGVKAMATLSSGIQIAKRVVGKSRKKASQKRVLRAVRGSASNLPPVRRLSRQEAGIEG